MTPIESLEAVGTEEQYSLIKILAIWVSQRKD